MIRFYDIGIDEVREATQADFDKLKRIAECYSRAKGAIDAAYVYAMKARAAIREVEAIAPELEPESRIPAGIADALK